jgi:hypothetical protein
MAFWQATDMIIFGSATPERARVGTTASFPSTKS